MEWGGIPQENVPKIRHKSGTSPDTWSEVTLYHTHDTNGNQLQLQLNDTRWSATPKTALALSYWGALDAVQLNSLGDHTCTGNISSGGNVTCVNCNASSGVTTNTLSCVQLFVNGTQFNAGGGSVPVGSVLKKTRFSLRTQTPTAVPGTFSTTWTTILSQTYTPVSNNSQLLVTFSGTMIINNPSGVDQTYTLTFSADNVVFSHGAKMISNILPDSSPVLGLWDNNTTSQITLRLLGRQLYPSLLGP